MTEASFVPVISHTVTDFPFSSPAPWRRGAPRAVFRAHGRAGSPVSVLSPEAPRLLRAPGSETPRPIISHIISLSPGQQIPINLPSKLFPILDQATSVCGRREPTGLPPSLSAPLPSSLLTHPGMIQIPSLLPDPGTPSLAHTIVHSTLLSSRHPQRVRTGGPEGWRECGGVLVGRPPLPVPHSPLDYASLCSPSLI